MTTAEAVDGISDSLRAVLVSPNVADSNMEAANIVDVVDKLARSTRRIADAITPNIAGGKDDAGGHVESLTEAVMGMTSGLLSIAGAIETLAQAVRESRA